MRYEDLAVGECYHVFTRGVEHCPIFLDEQDHRRFYEGMFLFNDTRSSVITHDAFRRYLDVSFGQYCDTRNRLVNIVSFCLMSNHYHLLLEQIAENGISRFLHRLNMGYVKYFNLRHSRTGVLFDGRFQAVLIQKESQLEHVPKYIHLNALDRAGLPWREGILSGWDKALHVLDNYPWSSHRVYVDGLQELPVVHQQIVTEFFPTGEEYIRSLKDWSGRYLPDFIV